MRLTLTLLGGFEARLDAGLALEVPAKARALLAYLGLPAGHAHPRDKIAALLWGDAGVAQARDSLRHLIGGLRRALAGATPSPLVRHGETFALDATAVDIDVATFERCVAEGTPEALERAAALYQGDLVEGLSVTEPGFEEWLLAERERLRELAVDALSALLGQQARSGSTARAIRTALRLLALDPLLEATHRVLMRLYARQGRRAAALQQYQAWVRILRRELAAEPEAETKQLYQEILRRWPGHGDALGASDRRSPEVPHATRGSRVDVAPHETPLIGRGPEMARLRQALHHTIEGRGGAVIILGEAGVGKSRLTEELRADAFERGSRVLTGYCHESEQILALGPWLDALRAGGVAGRAELETPGRLPPELSMPGGAASSPGDHLRLFGVLAQVFAQLASTAPLVIVLDDLHWADEMSLRLLSFLARRLQGCAALVVGTARVDEPPAAPAVRQLLHGLAAELRAVPITLSPLSRSETAAVVGALARRGTEAAALAQLAEQVWRRSEGNPFVIVEAMHALQDRPAGEAGAVPLPERVRELIAERLERLSDLARGLVAVAAVLGREFDFALLRRSARLTEQDAAAGLEELVRRHVLQGFGEHFEFVHDRIREVALGQLLAPRENLLRRQAAEAIEALHR